MSLGEPEQIVPGELVVVEGAYSMHPELSEHYDLTVFLDIASALQKNRILKRNSPEMAVRFFEEWIPMEENYFRTFGMKEKCDLIMKVMVD